MLHIGGIRRGNVKTRIELAIANDCTDGRNHPGVHTSGFQDVINQAGGSRFTIRARYTDHDKFTGREIMPGRRNMGQSLTAVGYTDIWNQQPFDRFNTIDRYTGVYAPIYWGLLFCNVVVPQLIWFKKIRTNPWILFVIAMFVNLGMWMERFIIVVQSLTKDFLPSSWFVYTPTIWDVATLLGTIGFFLTLIYLFIRVLLSISIFELRELFHKKYAKPKTAQSSVETSAD